MDRFWIDHWFATLYGNHPNQKTLNQYYEQMIKRLLDGSMQSQHYIGSFNPFDFVDEFTKIINTHIDDMENNEQVEADMTITRKGKTYLVNIKSIPALNMDEESQEEPDESSDSAEEE